VIRVIVLNWNGARWLDRCLTALTRQQGCAFEVVVVDNASTDGSAEIVRDRFPECRVVALDANVGFAAGNNAGARDATVPYLVFLNNDTEVQPGWLAALAAAVERDAQIGLVTSHIVFMDRPDLVDSAGDGYLRCGAAFKHRHGQPLEGRSGELEVFGACGAGFLIRRELFERLGGFDEDYFMVYEDVDLSYRARLLGATCVLARSAVVKHAGSGSLGRMSPRAVYYGQRNLEWTWIKNSPAPLLWRSLPAHVLYDLAGFAGYARAGQLGAWVRGKLAALAELPAVLRKRRHVQRAVAVDPGALWRVMDRDWIGIKRREKAFTFDRGSAGSARDAP
jgi:GT2 family glycosyltransferase